MPHLVWTPPALSDLRRLIEFLAEKNQAIAESAAQRLLEGVQILERHPDIGKPTKEYGIGFREWSIRFAATGYVALYRHQGDDVTLLRLRSFCEAGFNEPLQHNAEAEQD